MHTSADESYQSNGSLHDAMVIDSTKTLQYSQQSTSGSVAASPVCRWGTLVDGGDCEWWRQATGDRLPPTRVEFMS